MIRIIKAFIIGKSDVVIAVIIFVSSGTRPNSRTILKARINRTSHSGMLSGPRSMRDIATITRSRIFHPFWKNLNGQFANKLIESSIVNIAVKSKLILMTNESN